MQKLNLLKKGDKVAIVSSARKISKEEVECAKNLFTLWGLQVLEGKSIGAECNQFAGNDSLRTEDIQSFLDDDSIKAIFFARGGYGSVRIIDKLDFSRFLLYPKWLVGYSDVTVFLLHTYFCFSLPSLHAIMPVNINSCTLESKAVLSLKQALFSPHRQIEFQSNIMNKEGTAEGIVIGGNLSMLYSLLGSVSFGSTQDMILFIEDLDEYLYHIDRMMQALKRAGKLSGLKGLIVGAMSDMHDNTIPFGQNAQQIIHSALAEYDYPVCFCSPFGHIEGENIALVEGAMTTLCITKDKVTITQ